MYSEFYLAVSIKLKNVKPESPPNESSVQFSFDAASQHPRPERELNTIRQIKRFTSAQHQTSELRVSSIFQKLSESLKNLRRGVSVVSQTSTEGVKPNHDKTHELTPEERQNETTKVC